MGSNSDTGLNSALDKKGIKKSVVAILMWISGLMIPIVFLILAFYDFEEIKPNRKNALNDVNLDSLNEVINGKMKSIDKYVSGKTDSIGEINKLLLSMIKSPNQTPIVIDPIGPDLVEVLQSNTIPVSNSPKINLDVIKGMQTEILFFQNCGYCNQPFDVDLLKEKITNNKDTAKTTYLTRRYSDIVRRIILECNEKKLLTDLNRPKMVHLSTSLSSNNCNTDFSFLFFRLEKYLERLEKNWSKLRGLQDELNNLIDTNNSEITSGIKKQVLYEDFCLISLN